MSRLLARLQRQRLEAEAKAAVEKALRDSGPAKTTDPKATAGGDLEQLRGIPAIGKGVEGAVRGTRPDRAKLG